MKELALSIALTLILTGCSKGGGGDRLLNGGEVPIVPTSQPADGSVPEAPAPYDPVTNPDPTPTDIGFPGPSSLE